MNEMSGRSPNETSVRGALQRIRVSRAFANSKKLLQFLEYVVETKLRGDEINLKETSIAVGLYNRDTSYDPKADSIVRTQAKRVRDRLEEYYGSEGVDDPLIIRLPKGGYSPVFEVRQGTVPVAVATPAPELAPEPDASAQARNLWILSLALLLALIVGLSIYLWPRLASHPLKPAAQAAPRVAVLRFRTQTVGPDEELYGRALADSVVSWLTRINGLSVVTPPDSSTRGSIAIPSDLEVAQIVRADYLVTGDFSKEKRESRMQVMLREVASGTVLLSRTYSFSWANLVNIEDQMGEAVAHSLAARLGVHSAVSTVNVPPESAAAYQAYLNGHSAAAATRQTFQLESAKTAERNLKRALDLDPNYADALAELGRLRLLFALPGTRESEALIAQAESFARRALEVAPRHVLSNAVLAQVAVLRFRPREGLEYAKRAVELDPGSIPALDSVADAYEALGLYESAVLVYGRVAKMDPVDVEPFLFGGPLLARLGRFDEATKRVQELAAIDSNSPHIPFIEAEILIRKGDFPAAEELVRKLREMMMARLAGDQKQAYLYGYIDRVLALAQLRQGREDFARQTLAAYGAVLAGRLDTQILITTALAMPKEALRNIELNPYYQSYRYLVTEPGLKPLYGVASFQQLLDTRYTEWARTLEELRDSLPSKPPQLASPGEFLAANGFRGAR